MPMSGARWTMLSPASSFAWEQEALDLVQAGLPDHDPWRAWALFEFIGTDGTLNEIDLLVASPVGLFLVEIKSWPGTVSGDAGQWLLDSGTGLRAVDNPLYLANRKCKRLKSLLAHQAAYQGKPIPRIEPLIFLSHPEVRVNLQGAARQGVCLRDRAADGDRPERKGILAALTRREAGDLSVEAPQRIDRPAVKLLVRAVEQAGIRVSQRARRFGDYIIDELLGEGPDGIYQDYRAHHASVPGMEKRLRVYPVARTTGGLSREELVRAAQRELRVISGINHPGILRADTLVEHDLGPALVFDHPRGAQRLDQYLAEHGKSLSIDVRLGIVRRVAEALAHAHEKRVIHRGLSPQGILVLDPASPEPPIAIFNWQAGATDPNTTRRTSSRIEPTRHIRELFEASSTAYIAPEEARTLAESGPQSDVYSLGAVAYFVLTGAAPGPSFGAVHERLQQSGALDITADLDAAHPVMRELVLDATRGDLGLRYESVREFLQQLDRLEDALTSPDDGGTPPLEARAGDQLEGGYLVKGRLGSGSTAIVLRVERNGTESVLKIANGPDHNEQVRTEGEVLLGLRHENIVEAQGTLTIGGLVAIEMQLAGEEILSDRLRRDGPLLAEWLERFGDNLLSALDYLERKGVAHRDIKPDNLAVAKRGRGDARHLVLFDFSLSRARADAIEAGTQGYIDPFLSQRRRWDEYAERWSAAATLYEMATGVLPRFGDGVSDPALLSCEVTIEADRIDPAVREGLAAFFQKALRREAKERHDNAEAMLVAWREAFREARQPPAQPDRPSVPEDDAALAAQFALAMPNSHVIELPLSARAISALDRVGIQSVEQLLRAAPNHLAMMRGVGTRTRTEILTALRRLRQRFPEFVPGTFGPPEEGVEEGDSALLGLDQVVQKILPRRARLTAADRAVTAVLGLDAPDSPGPTWRTQTDAAQSLGITAAQVSLSMKESRERWRRLPALTTLRDTILELLDAQSGLAGVSELAAALLAARGAAAEGPRRARLAWAALRAATESETHLAAPRWIARRIAGTAVLARVADDSADAAARAEAAADYAGRLGRKADQLVHQDPLPSAATVASALRGISLPEGLSPLSETRLVRLAAAASQESAVSSRLDLYPRGMSAERALRLSANGLLAGGEITPAEIVARIATRFPEAERLPDRPALDELLEQVGIEVRWEPEGAGGKGAFRSVALGPTFSTRRERTRYATAHGPLPTSPDVIAAEELEQRLLASLEEGRPLILTVAPRDLQRAEMELSRFAIASVSLEQELLDALRESARAVGADWNAVVRADALGARGPDWPKVRALAQRALPQLRQRVGAAGPAVLLTRPGLLVRYGHMSFLEDILLTTGQRGAPHATWVLLPTDDQSALPLFDGQPLPVPTPGAWSRIPEAWLRNLHRAGMEPSPAAGEAS